MGLIVDSGRWPVVTVSVADPADLDHLADELDAILAREEPFALTVTWPRTIETFQDLLWAAPDARRRLRRLRARLAAWCDAAAHVLDGAASGHTTPSELRCAELIWGCETLAADSEDDACAQLLTRLADRRLRVELAPV